MAENKLTAVRRLLGSYPAITVLGETEDDEILSMNTYGRPAHRVSIFIAPVRPLYEAAQLQELLVLIKKRLSFESDSYKFRVGGDWLYLTGIVCTETIGKAIGKVKIELNKGESFPDGSRVKVLGNSMELTRSIHVRLFPNVHFAELAMTKPACTSECYIIPLKELREPNGRFF